MSILRYSRKSVTEGFSEAPVLFPGFPGAMPGTRAAKLWRKSCKMVNHPPAPPKSAGMFSRHRNRREMGQRSPPCSSCDTATMREIPPTWIQGRMGHAPHTVLSFFPQNTCSCPKHSARTGYDAQAKGEIQGGASWEESGATRWGSMKKGKGEEGYVGMGDGVVGISEGLEVCGNAGGCRQGRWAAGVRGCR